MSASCPDENQILAQLEGQLSAAEVEAIDVHLEGCGACRRLLGDLAQALSPASRPPPLALTVSSAARSGSSLPPLPLQPGAVLGRYHILRWIGSGGMGIVYAAYDPALDRRVALKLVRSGWAEGAEADAPARLRREARSLARLSHPNVVAAYDVGRVGEQVFITMEFVQGENLRLWLRAAPRSPAAVLASLRQAGAGLAAAHQVGLVHRDFKPDNVLCGQDGVVRVTDFGLARVVGAPLPAAPEGGRFPDAQGAPPAESSSRSGVVLGTPTYMAPELHRGGRADARSDQYAFCISLYESLYGSPPFTSERQADPAAVPRRADDLRAPPGARARVPTWVHDILRRGLHPAPEQRFPSMQALLEALERDPWALRRQRARAAALLLAGVIGSSLMLASLRDDPCQGALARLGGAWDGERRAAVREALRRTGRPGWEDTWQRVAVALDQYARGWVAQEREVCGAALHRELSAELGELRRQCLEQRRSELQALTEVLIEGGAQMADKAVKASSALTDLGTCVSLTTLSAPERPPADAANTTCLVELRARQARLKALRDADRHGEGLALAQDALLAAQRLGYRPLEAELLLTLGYFQLRLLDRRAEQTTREALRVAEVARHDQAKLDAMLLLVRIVGLHGLRYPEAERLARDAQATLDRIGGDERRGAELDRLLARLLAEQGRFADGEQP